jgi:hypothetical protein
MGSARNTLRTLRQYRHVQRTLALRTAAWPMRFTQAPGTTNALRIHSFVGHAAQIAISLASDCRAGIDDRWPRLNDQTLSGSTIRSLLPGNTRALRVQPQWYRHHCKTNACVQLAGCSTGFFVVRAPAR